VKSFSFACCLCIYLEAVKFHFRFISFRFITLVSLMIFFLPILIFVLCSFRFFILVSFWVRIACVFWLLKSFLSSCTRVNWKLNLYMHLHHCLKGRMPRPLVMPMSAQSVPRPPANDSSHSDFVTVIFCLLSWLFCRLRHRFSSRCQFRFPCLLIAADFLVFLGMSSSFSGLIT